MLRLKKEVSEYDSLLEESRKFYYAGDKRSTRWSTSMASTKGASKHLINGLTSNIDATISQVKHRCQLVREETRQLRSDDHFKGMLPYLNELLRSRSIQGWNSPLPFSEESGDNVHDKKAHSSAGPQRGKEGKPAVNGFVEGRRLINTNGTGRERLSDGGRAASDARGGRISQHKQEAPSQETKGDLRKPAMAQGLGTLSGTYDRREVVGWSEDNIFMPLQQL